MTREELLDVFSHKGCFSIPYNYYTSTFIEKNKTREELLEYVTVVSPGTVMDTSVIHKLFFNDSSRFHSSDSSR